ncbi:MAG: tRNA pseudouridine(55) synthase TruB [Syntrophales bacterium]
MNGIVPIHKPSGRTSHDVVEEIRRIPGIKKAGHTGTLDPLATGVLPVCLNEATKLVQFLIQEPKSYRATMLLGVATDTLDIEGEIVERGDVDVRREDVESALKSFSGTLRQKPPRYSAVKFRGKPLYKWTRRGIHVEPAPRIIEIYRIEILDMDLPYVTFSVDCSAGTYIRSLCRDIGAKLGCPACLSGLVRTRNGPFREDKAVSLEGFDTDEKKAILEKNMISIDEMLPHLSAVVVGESLACRLRSGLQPTLEDIGDIHMPRVSAGDTVKFVSGDKRLIAVARMLYSSDEMRTVGLKKSLVKILRVFNH